MWSRQLHRFSARSGCNGAAVFDRCGLGGCIGFLLDLAVMVLQCLMGVV